MSLRRNSLAMCLSVVLLATGCGGGSSGGGADGGGAGDGAGGDGDGGGGGGPDGGVGTARRLIESAWTLDAFSEKFQCERWTATEDLWITEITPVGPVGTHHTLLAIDQNPDPDGTSPCGTAGFDWAPFFASGVDSPTLRMPAGVGFRVNRGEQVLLNLHLYNYTEGPITGTSAIDVKTVPADQVEHEAQVILAGDLNFSVPDTGADVVVRADCTFDRPATVFSTFPHMHQYGTHMKIDLERAAGNVTVHDAAFDFDQQTFVDFTPTAMAAGDKLKVACTYNVPPGTGTVRFGESSDDEMCFGITYRYPPAPTLPLRYCDDTPL